MSVGIETLGLAEVKKMQREGWKFPADGVRVANGWVVMAVSPTGEFVPQVLADPEQEPEKWPEDPALSPGLTQGELGL